MIHMIFKSHYNFPNPFRSATLFNIEIEYNSLSLLKIYDILGKEELTSVYEKQFADINIICWLDEIIIV